MKSWDGLSESYRHRITRWAEREGLSPREVYRDRLLRDQAVGHGKTPRSPLQALRDPQRYRSYVEKNREKLQARLEVDPKARRAVREGMRTRRIEGRAPIALEVPQDLGAGHRSSKTFRTVGEAVRYMEEGGVGAMSVGVVVWGPEGVSVWFPRTTP